MKGCASPRTQFQLHVLCEGRFAEYLFLLGLQRTEYAIVCSLHSPQTSSSFSYTSRGILIYEPGFNEFFFPKKGLRMTRFILEAANKQSKKAEDGKY